MGRKSVVPEATTSIGRLKQIWTDCQRCKLCEMRSTVVIGRGNAPARLLIIGEAPGREEDESGLAFVGAAGREMERLCSPDGIDFSQVYIANVVGCRPPFNRTPMPNEITKCRPRLSAIVGLVQPAVILLLGNTAMGAVIGMTGVNKNRGTWHRSSWEWRGKSIKIPTTCTFHPAGLLPGRIRDDNEVSGDRVKFRRDVKAAWDQAFGVDYSG